MATTQPTPQNTVCLHKLVRAPRQKVYDTWLDARDYVKWFAPDPRSQCTEVTIDATVGGTMRLVMASPDGDHIGVGTFLELIPGQKIVYIWIWEDMPEFGGNSKITLELFDADNPFEDGPATEIVLTHEGLNSAIERSEHTGGWWGTLRAIGYYVRGVDPREAMYGQTQSTSS